MCSKTECTTGTNTNPNADAETGFEIGVHEPWDGSSSVEVGIG